MDLKYQPHDKKVVVGMGTEYQVLSTLSLRAGYAAFQGKGAGQFDGSETESLSSLAGLSGGFGLRLGGYLLDYAFTPFGDLGNVQRVSLSARF
ncbi:MAG: hypothetical protein HY402_02185 [Elusimicrobia bacterium]|nr:hypothetical protein [Elusimicrobiota bacterium]